MPDLMRGIGGRCAGSASRAGGATPGGALQQIGALELGMRPREAG